MNKQPAIVVTLASTKGGCGKTAISDTLGNYLALNGKKVLMIDLNSQKDLTRTYADKVDPNDLKNSSIYRAFKHDAKDSNSKFPSNFKPVNVGKNLDLMASSKKLRYVNEMMRIHQPMLANFVISHIMDHADGLGLSDKYDYIIMDTHNDTDTPVKNAILASDYVLCPVTPSRFGMDSVRDTIDTYNTLKDKLRDPKSRQSFIEAKLLFIGNLIKFNTSASNQFTEAISNNSVFIASFHDRELFNKSAMAKENIFSYAHDEVTVKHNRNDLKAVNNEISPELKKIVKVINKE